MSWIVRRFVIIISADLKSVVSWEESGAFFTSTLAQMTDQYLVAVNVEAKVVDLFHEKELHHVCSLEQMDLH